MNENNISKYIAKQTTSKLQLRFLSLNIKKLFVYKTNIHHQTRSKKNITNIIQQMEEWKT